MGSLVSSKHTECADVSHSTLPITVTCPSFGQSGKDNHDHEKKYVAKRKSFNTVILKLNAI